MSEAGPAVPERLAMFPLGTVLFPTVPLLLHVFEERYRALVRDCLEGDRRFGVALITRGSEVGGGDERAHVGTVARIEEAKALDDGRWLLATMGCDRLEVTEWLPDDPYPRARVRELPSVGGPSQAVAEVRRDAEQAVRRARALLSELGRDAALPPDLSLGANDELALWKLCRAAPLSAFDAQKLLEQTETLLRARLLVSMMDQMADDLSRLLSGSDELP